MMNIQSVLEKYSSKIDRLDLDLLIAAAIKKPRELVLTHPDYKIPKFKIENLKFKIARRRRGEPLAYILGQKEFYGLDFKVNRHALIPRPETEQLVELTLKELKTKNYQLKTSIIDVGTGSGNIIISIVNAINKFKVKSSHRLSGIPLWRENLKFIGIDISQKALRIAKQNAKKHKLSKKINFLHGNLLEPILKVKSRKPARNASSASNASRSDTDWHIEAGGSKVESYIIIANLPYLSKKIYNTAPNDVKNYEPRSALLSNGAGLAHYQELLLQLKKIKTKNSAGSIIAFWEFSPEQKNQLKKVILSAFPQCSITFFKDLAGKFRIIQIKL